MMKPFQILWELIVFGLQAAFIYILVIIVFMGILFIVIKDNHQPKPAIVYKDRVVKEYIYPKETIEKVKECIRPAGCRINETGEVEY